MRSFFLGAGVALGVACFSACTDETDSAAAAAGDPGGSSGDTTTAGSSNNGGSTTGAPAGTSCTEIWDCYGDCMDEACYVACHDAGSALARQQDDALLGCIDANACPDVPCVQENCPAEIDACFGGGCEPACGPDTICQAGSCVPVAVEPPCPINVGGAMIACVELEGLTLGDCQSAETWGQYPCCGPHLSSCALDHLADQPACRDCVFAVSQDLTYCGDLGVDFSPCTGE